MSNDHGDQGNRRPAARKRAALQDAAAMATPPTPPSPPFVGPASASPALSPAALRRGALAEQILLDALRVSWTMGTSVAETAFGSTEKLAATAVKAADALWANIEGLERNQPAEAK